MSVRPNTFPIDLEQDAPAWRSRGHQRGALGQARRPLPLYESRTAFPDVRDHLEFGCCLPESAFQSRSQIPDSIGFSHIFQHDPSEFSPEHD